MASKQLRAEEDKTISITQLVGLRFAVIKEGKKTIEIVNRQDNGRVCTLKCSDFRSQADAEVYAELLRLAPQLLYAYISDAQKLKEVVGRLERRFRRMKARQSSKKRSRARKRV